ncbi:MAG: HD domain-containing protein [Acidobacteriia bacterium]|nr:HD domain-containing protein [Terriglobia bacterium]
MIGLVRRPLPLSLRVFGLTFVPICVALAVSFLIFRWRLEENVKAGLRETIRNTQEELVRVRADAETQQQRLVGTIAENPSLKAGIALWRQMGDHADTRRTIEDQLFEICANLNYDLMIVFDSRNEPIAAVVRKGGKTIPLPANRIPPRLQSMAVIDDGLYSLIKVPINIDSENLGALSVGRSFDASVLGRHGVLTSNGRVLRSNVTELRPAGIEAGLSACQAGKTECQAALHGETFLISKVGNTHLGTGFAIWNFQSVDAASRPLIRAQGQSLLIAAAATLFAALFVAVFASRSIAKPMTHLVEALRESERTGVLRSDFEIDTGTQEVDQLARALNTAAGAIADSQRRLDAAYLEFTRTMAQTLDARDHYTAGHSQRVSDYALAVAEALSVSTADKDVIQIGANLHDIGKIGIPDAVLQKSGRLTPAEFEIIKQHTVIGKRILESVARFHDYLAIVELHHENHDGTGYPWGLTGEQIPLAARIVHVVDAYDAMTSSRPYRGAMPHETALKVLRDNAGTQFDPAIVEVFLRLIRNNPPDLAGATAEQLAALNRNLIAVQPSVSKAPSAAEQAPFYASSSEEPSIQEVISRAD